MLVGMSIEKYMVWEHSMSLFCTLPRRRKIIFLLCLLVLITGFSFICYKVFQRPRLNHAGFAQVQIGMSLAKVERLMGGPEGNYRRGPGWVEQLGFASTVHYDVGTIKRVWSDQKCRYEIFFDDTDYVVGKHQPLAYSEIDEDYSWLDWICDYLGLTPTTTVGTK